MEQWPEPWCLEMGIAASPTKWINTRGPAILSQLEVPETGSFGGWCSNKLMRLHFETPPREVECLFQ